ncbi:MAG: hypothetical protein ACTS2F_21720 [Thainema sp.]
MTLHTRLYLKSIAATQSSTPVERIVTGLLLTLALIITAVTFPQAKADGVSVPQKVKPQAELVASNSPAVESTAKTYLFGQSATAEQIGATYIVFTMQDQKVVGAFYMPQSSFDCFHGEVVGEQLALNITNSYDQTTYPYEVALASNAVVAGTDAAAPFGLEGFHAIETISETDQQVLSTCQAIY